MTRFAGVAPVGWSITASCVDCGSMTRCYGDGEHWLCRRCVDDPERDVPVGELLTLGDEAAA